MPFRFRYGERLKTETCGKKEGNRSGDKMSYWNHYTVSWLPGFHHYAGKLSKLLPALCQPLSSSPVSVTLSLPSLSPCQPQLSLSVHLALPQSFFSFSPSVCWGASKSGTSSCPNTDGPPLCVEDPPYVPSWFRAIYYHSPDGFRYCHHGTKEWPRTDKRQNMWRNENEAHEESRDESGWGM